jgi:3-oxosteroid 1-dehydrogenase
MNGNQPGTGPKQAEEDEPVWDRTVDLLTFGGGAGGMTAALVGALEGLESLLCEKTSLLGGTTSMSAGTIWIPGSRQGAQASGPNDTEAAARYLDAEIHRSDGDGSRAEFLRCGPSVLDYLERRTQVQFTLGISSPDYHSGQPGASLRGRALVVEPFDGRHLGKDLTLIRPPRSEFMMLGGMMVGRDDLRALRWPLASRSNFLQACRLLARHGSDRLRFSRGTRLIHGNALVARLLYSLRAAGAGVFTSAELLRLIYAQGRVAGALVRVEGKDVAIQARRGVVLATGGASRAAALNYSPMAFSLMPETNTGDGVALASAIGASVDTTQGSEVFWMPVSVLRENSQANIFPHVAADRAKPGLIAVNSAGRRFVNEGASYHDFVLGMLSSHQSAPSIPAYLICDDSFIRDFGVGHVRPHEKRLRRFVDAGYLTVAGTIRELAIKIGVDPEGLATTIKRHNTFAREGNDADFGKGTTALNIFNGDAQNRPNPCLRAIEVAPYYAVAVYPADFAASAGLRTDSDARVLDARSTTIAGLYACGADMSSIMSGAYPGPGTALGPALVFGWRAAMSAAGR